MAAMLTAMAGMLVAMGIIAIQKSLNMKVGVNITPSHEIRIDYGGETIFCNTTKDGNTLKVGNGFTLSGTTLTFTQEFISIGETFALTIYNYNTSYLQVSTSGTGVSSNSITIDPYSTTASSGVLNLTISAGATQAVLSFYIPSSCSVSYTGSNYTFSGSTSVLENNMYSTSFSAPQYYNLPDAITITMGGETLTSGYTYTKTSDTAATLTIDSVTGDVVITCNATADAVTATINIYLNDNLNQTSSLSLTITYPTTSRNTIISKSGDGNFSPYTFSNMTGEGTGYTWNFSKYHSTAASALRGCLNFHIAITWGVVADSITIDIYGTRE